MKCRVRRNSKVTIRKATWREETELSLETVARFCESIHPAPDETIYGDNSCRHHDSCREKKIEVARIGGLADCGSQTNCGVSLAFEMKIFGHDACVPGATGSGDKPSDKIGEYPGQDEFLPALEACQSENRAGFLQVRRDRDSSSDDVEKDVPLRSQ